MRPGTGRDARALAIVVGVLSLLGFSMASAASTSSTSASGSPTPAALALSTVPPKLPADGGSFPAVVVSLETSSGGAALASQSTTVFLTSSLPGIGSIEGQVTILKDSSFTVANFSTSSSPGSTTISASSSGLTSASAQLATVVPSGYPTKLAVIPVPGTQITSPGSQGTLIVEALDSSGFPARASVAAPVTLSSSNNDIVSLSSTTLTFTVGAVIDSTVYTVGTEPGKATISATSSGYNSGTGTVTIVGNSPSGLLISAEPNPVATSTSGSLVVTLTDSQGRPTPAPGPVSIVISSSNTTSVAPSQAATIEPGHVYALVNFQSGQSPGTANLTASSPGLKSASTLVAVSRPDNPAKLGLVMSPDPVPANNQSYTSMVVELEDTNGAPAVAAGQVSVTLTSSNSNVGQVAESLSIPSGSSYAVAAFSSTYLVGSTFITAIAQNLQSATLSLTSFGPSPTQIVAQALPSVLPADGGSYSALVVALEDASGQPAIASTSTAVQLTSSSTTVLAVNDTMVIPAGQSYAVSAVTTSGSPGSANVTAAASGFAAATIGFTTVSPAPTKLGIYIGPNSTMTSLGPGTALVAVQLQDSTSSPGRAAQDTTVVVTSSNSSVISKSLSIKIPAGSDYGWAYVNATQSGTAMLTASSSGLASGNARVSVVVPTISLTLTSSSSSIPLTGAAILQLQLQLLGAPLAGAPITITSTSGTISSPSGVTDQSGSFSDTFIPTTKGVAIIIATVDAAPFGNQSASATVDVVGPGGASGGSQSPTVHLIDTLLPLVIVIVVVAVVVVMLRRSIKKRRETDEEPAEEE